MNHNAISMTSTATAGWRPRFRTFLVVMLAAGSVALSGCGEDPMTLEVVGYNHTDEGIYAFAVNKSGGPYLAPHRGGGNFTCCASVPRTYRPGMTLDVEWVNNIKDIPKQRTVVVPPYRPQDGGMLSVHFLRDGNVKVFVTMVGPRHPTYPLQGDEARL